MKDIITTVWGQTKLIRGALALGSLIIFGTMLIGETDVPTWFQTLGSTAILSYFVGRAAESPAGGQ